MFGATRPTRYTFILKPSCTTLRRLLHLAIQRHQYRSLNPGRIPTMSTDNPLSHQVAHADNDRAEPKRKRTRVTKAQRQAAEADLQAAAIVPPKEEEIPVVDWNARMRTYEISLVPGGASTSVVPTSSVAQTGDNIDGPGKKRKTPPLGAETDTVVSGRTSTSVVPTPPGVDTGGSSEVAGDERRPTSPSSNTHLPLWFQTTFNKMLDLFELHIKREMGKLHEEHILGLTEGYHNAIQAAELRAEQAEKSARQAEEKNLHLQSQLLQAEQRAKAAEILVQQVSRSGEGMEDCKRGMRTMPLRFRGRR